jgi:hypothetical protein
MHRSAGSLFRIGGSEALIEPTTTTGMNSVLVHIFRGPGRVFGFTADDTGSNLPPHYAPWSVFKSVELSPDKPTPGVNAVECLDDIDKHGFHLTDAHARITESFL